jgi:hypothetical protein
LVVSAALVQAGCAGGESVDEGGDGGAAGVAFYGGYGGTGGSGGSSASGGSGATGAKGGSGGTTATGGTGGNGATGGSGATGGTGGTSCPTPNTCDSAEDLGVMSGDTDGAPVVKTGFGSTFVKLRVTEDNHSVIGHALKVSVSLDVAVATDYDVYAYLNVNTDVSPCSSVSTNKSDGGGIGTNESFGLSWGDGLTGSGNDDSRTVVIEVKHKAGPCDDTAPYTLTLTGNK